jgi:hypothetical protein
MAERTIDHMLTALVARSWLPMPSEIGSSLKALGIRSRIVTRPDGLHLMLVEMPDARRAKLVIESLRRKHAREND